MNPQLQVACLQEQQAMRIPAGDDAPVHWVTTTFRRSRKNHMIETTRRTLLAMAAAVPTGLWAQSPQWPSKPIRIVHGFSAAAATDTFARGVGELITAATKQACFVESKPGAGGVIGTEFVAKAAPDGYILYLGTAGTNAINASLYKKLPYDILKDFAPITNMGDIPNVLVVNKDLPVKDTKSFIDYLKGKAGELNYGTSGNGTSMHLAAEQFMNVSGTKMIHVPYRQSSAAVTDLMGGQIQLMFHQVPAVLELIKSGQIRALAVTSKSRVSVLPEVPTVAEAGYPGFESITWYALFAPAGTPADIINKINSIVTDGLRKDFGKRLADLGVVVRPSTPEELKQTVVKDSDYWGKIVRRLNITLD
ncbi:Bug family tripartite tricarboxylate transporter substrate binding protein [Variovorax sp. N23]|uniref:Bug family tripartite tricarboxylate transporter substrate binding protein n=1 Tax=Variovorax sp. N23 TaxID=2980555 RepID=UPI0021C79F7B|nr:tripartite tricarboxylate transporter substrate binding protein [Variovorax sp. N23]MCU4119039.1 tripartite tricarboxylate transporter substrate binding protein [Variovorax sp. N23]